MALGLVVWSGMTALTGLAQTFTQLAVARIGVGIGEAACTPPAHSLLSDYFPPEREALLSPFSRASQHARRRLNPGTVAC